MLTAIPKSWFTWDFSLTEGEQPLAEIDMSWWREKGVLSIAGAPWRVYREAPCSGAFILEGEGGVVARAVKPSSFTRRMVIEYANTRYELRPAGIFTRQFLLLSGSSPVGRLSPASLWTRRMNIELPPGLPLPLRTFIVWLTLLLWKRDADAAG